MRALCVSAIGVLLAGIAAGQTLQRRAPGTAASAPVQAEAHADARQGLPLAAEGEYRWGEPGEVIELYVEDQVLHGYLTRRSERAEAGSAPMTFSFAHTAASARGLSFTTRQIHGDWYSFQGAVVRGPSASPQKDGYYLLQGALVLHPAHPSGSTSGGLDNGGAVSRQVSLLLTGSRHPAE